MRGLDTRAMPMFTRFAWPPEMPRAMALRGRAGGGSGVRVAGQPRAGVQRVRQRIPASPLALPAAHAGRCTRRPVCWRGDSLADAHGAAAVQGQHLDQLVHSRLLGLPRLRARPLQLRRVPAGGWRRGWAAHVWGRASGRQRCMAACAAGPAGAATVGGALCCHTRGGKKEASTKAASHEHFLHSQAVQQGVKLQQRDRAEAGGGREVEVRSARAGERPARQARFPASSQAPGPLVHLLHIARKAAHELRRGLVARDGNVALRKGERQGTGGGREMQAGQRCCGAAAAAGVCGSRVVLLLPPTQAPSTALLHRASTCSSPTVLRPEITSSSVVLPLPEGLHGQEGRQVGMSARRQAALALARHSWEHAPARGSGRRQAGRQTGRHSPHLQRSRGEAGAGGGRGGWREAARQRGACS